jgi:hypothetical protein
VELFVEVFPLPGADGSEMIAYRNRIQFDANERLYPDRVRSTSLAAHPQFQVRETTVSGAQERLVWYWYDVDGMMLVSPSRAKLAEALALLRHGRGAAPDRNLDTGRRVFGPGAQADDDCARRAAAARAGMTVTVTPRHRSCVT